MHNIFAIENHRRHGLRIFIAAILIVCVLLGVLSTETVSAGNYTDTFAEQPADRISPTNIFSTSFFQMGLPTMEIQGNGLTIGNGDKTPISADGTDMGNVAVDSSANSTFTIHNTGTAPLDLTGTPYVSVSDTTNFSVTTQPTIDPIAVGGSDSFIVQCAPTSVGIKTATVTINNDSAENPYTFDVTCTGTAPEIDVQYPPGTSIPAGSTHDIGNITPGSAVTVTYTIDNTQGTDNLDLETPSIVSQSNVYTASHSGMPSEVPAGSSASWSVYFDVGSSTGPFHFHWSTQNNDSDESSYDIRITGMSGDDRVISIQRPAGSSIANGGSDNLGDRNIGRMNLTYTVSNASGVDTLTVSDVTASNLVNVNNFSLDTVMPLTIAAGETSSFNISFDVLINGSFSYEMAVVNDDADANPYDITVSGTGIGGSAEIDIQHPAGTSIPAGDTHDIGNFAPGTAVTVTYTIDNTMGTDSLELDIPDIVSQHNVFGAYHSGMPSSIPAGDTASWSIYFNVGASPGPFHFNWATNTNDSDESSYDIRITGTCDGDAPEITSFTRQTPTTSPTNADTLVFRAIFNEDVTGVDAGDFIITGTTASIIDVSVVTPQTYDLTVSGGDLASLNGTVGIDLSSGQNITDLVGYPLTSVEPATDEIYLLDNTAPTVTINQSITQSDPTNASPINFTAVFSEPVTDFATGDVTLNSTAGATTGTVSEISPNDGTTYNIAVSGMMDNDTVIPVLGAGVAHDAAGNGNAESTSTDNQVTFFGNPEIDIQRPADMSIPDGGTDDIGRPGIGNVNLTYTIDNSSGTASLTIIDITASNENNVSGFTLDTAAPINIPAGDVGTVDIRFNVDLPGDFSFNMVADNNDSDESSYDIQVSGSAVDLVVMLDGNTSLQHGDVLTVGTNTINVEFNKEVLIGGPGVAGAADNPDNYLLIEDGPSNNGFDTVSCSDGLAVDDVSIPINSISYNDTNLTLTLYINNGNNLPDGNYRLVVCGTTSVEDLFGNELNNGAFDTVIDFQVNLPSEEDKTALVLPSTGFTPERTTALPYQPAALRYKNIALTLEIPALDQHMPIVNVPQVEGTWDVTWLGENAGYLSGTSFPTWQGNTVITGHVWNALNQPGPFINLKTLQYGDRIFIHAYGKTYVYEVRENTLLLPSQVDRALSHEDYDWVTLLTCEHFDPQDGSYKRRRMVRAVLIETR